MAGIAAMKNAALTSAPLQGDPSGLVTTALIRLLPLVGGLGRVVNSILG